MQERDKFEIFLSSITLSSQWQLVFSVTCVMDCCHSGSVLDLPYSYKPTKDGTIRMRQSMDSLTNLAFLYILAGGMLPELGFESVAENFQNVTGETMDNLQGVGVENYIDGWMGGNTVNSGFVDDAGYPNYLGVEGFDTDIGGDGVENVTAEVNQGDTFDIADDYGGDYGGDADCGEIDCDGCDAFGSVLGALLEDCL